MPAMTAKKDPMNSAKRVTGLWVGLVAMTVVSCGMFGSGTDPTPEALSSFDSGSSLLLASSAYPGSVGASSSGGSVPASSALVGTSSALAPSSSAMDPANRVNRIAFVTYYGSRADFTPVYSELTQLNLFQASVNADGTLNTSLIDGAAHITKVIPEAKAAGLKLFFTVGGSGHSANFNTVAADPTLRQAFADAIVAYAQSKGLDGVDIDWEFPASATEATDFTALMAVVKPACAAAGLKVSIDLPTDLHIEASRVAHMDYAIVAYADYFNVMTYDYVSGTTLGLHDPVAKVSTTLNWWIGKGFPASKLNMGIAFYGRDCRTTTVPRCTAIPWTTYQGQYLNAEPFDRGMLYFADETDRNAKAAALVSLGLAGVMYWEMNHDYFGNLQIDASRPFQYTLAGWWDAKLLSYGK